MGPTFSKREVSDSYFLNFSENPGFIWIVQVTARTDSVRRCLAIQLDYYGVYYGNCQICLSGWSILRKMHALCRNYSCLKV